MVGAVADRECAEAACWSAVADAVVREVSLHAVQHSEQRTRHDLIVEHAIGAASIAHTAALDASTLVAEATRRGDEAASEALAWRQVSDTLARECDDLRQRTAAHETMLQEEAALKRRLLEQELAAKSDATSVRGALQAEVHELQERRTALDREVRDLSRELDATRAAWQAHKVATLDEKQELEQQLSALRRQIATERSQLRELQERGNAGPSAASTPSAGAGGAAQRANAPNLSSGLMALQNVRDQLRELREADSESASPPRTASACELGSGARRASGDSDEGTPTRQLRHANSYTFYPAGAPSYGAGSEGGSGGSAASPWKARLLKLQGELKSLRSELGSSSPD